MVSSLLKKCPKIEAFAPDENHLDLAGCSQGISCLFTLGLAAPGSCYHQPFLSVLFYNKHWSKDLELVTSEALPASLSSFCLIVWFLHFILCLLVFPSFHCTEIAKSSLKFLVGVSFPGLQHPRKLLPWDSWVHPQCSCSVLQRFF